MLVKSISMGVIALATAGLSPRCQQNYFRGLAEHDLCGQNPR